MILLWGLWEDPPLAVVAAELERRSARFTVIDQAFMDRASVDVDANGRARSIHVGKAVVDLCAVTALYLRPYDYRQIEGLDLSGDAGTMACRVEQSLLELADVMEGSVITRPIGRHLNDSKPAQLDLVRTLAPRFGRPPTIVTTSGEHLVEFVRKHGRCVVKSVSGHRSRVRTISVDDLTTDRLDDVQWCPVQVQKWIAGDDVRVHVVGEQTFATRVISEADDYRYEGASLRATSLPDEIRRSCLELAKGMELPLAGIDLRRTAEGRWYCFEVNPSPAFTYYESRTGQPIAAGIADLLEASP